MITVQDIKNCKISLPNKLSDLLELSLVDLIKCERSPRYEINMGMYHTPIGSTCEVCLAGSVMAQTLNADRRLNINDTNYPDKLERKLNALDDLRCGDVGWALMYLDRRRKHSEHPLNRDIVPYDDNPGVFKREMRKLARDLREIGL